MRLGFLKVNGWGATIAMTTTTTYYHIATIAMTTTTTAEHLPGPRRTACNVKKMKIDHCQRR